MSIITINLTDNFSTFINKTNDISEVLGDVDTLVTGDSNVVDALNTVRSLLDAFDDSDEIKNIARSAISLVDNGGDGSFEYDSNNGRFTYTGPSANEVRAHFTAGAGLSLDENGIFSIAIGGITNELIANNSITSDRFRSRITLEIKNAAGNTIKTIYSPGS